MVEKKRLKVCMHVSPGVHKELTKMGMKTETYDDIIARLIVHYTTCGVARREQRPLTATDWANK